MLCVDVTLKHEYPANLERDRVSRGVQRRLRPSSLIQHCNISLSCDQRVCLLSSRNEESDVHCCIDPFAFLQALREDSPIDDPAELDAFVKDRDAKLRKTVLTICMKHAVHASQR
jgi:hypothetical protein